MLLFNFVNKSNKHSNLLQYGINYDRKKVLKDRLLGYGIFLQTNKYKLS